MQPQRSRAISSSTSKRTSKQQQQQQRGTQQQQPPPRPAPPVKRQQPLIEQSAAPRSPAPLPQQQQQQQQHQQQQRPLQFAGSLRYAQTGGQVSGFVAELLRLADGSADPVIVGMDSETPVIWVRGGDGKDRTVTGSASLLQLCYQAPRQQQPTCLLLPLSRFGLSRQTAQVLAHPNLVKVGIGLASDVLDLQQAYEAAAAVQPQGVLDLNVLAAACGLLKPLSQDEQQLLAAKQDAGLKVFRRTEAWGLAALLGATTPFTLKKQKRVQMSNWARSPLTQQQVEYAANDALAGWLCYHGCRQHWQQQQQPGAAPAARTEADQAWQQLLQACLRQTSAALERARETAAEKAASCEDAWAWSGPDQQDLSYGAARAGWADVPWVAAK